MTKKSRKKNNPIPFIKEKRNKINPNSSIKLLEDWFSEPDDLGAKFWKEFDKELQTIRFSIP